MLRITVGDWYHVTTCTSDFTVPSRSALVFGMGPDALRSRGSITGQVLRRRRTGLRTVARRTAAADAWIQVDHTVDVTHRIAKQHRTIFHGWMARSTIGVSWVRRWRWHTMTTTAGDLRAVNLRPFRHRRTSALFNSAVTLRGTGGAVPGRSCTQTEDDFGFIIAIHVAG